ncbi:hypothetical protein CLV97_1111 [Planifilum fimeticola]|uniref:Uncharacterized protein n=1 Tax=Planifilum fimeticola TaxID=201975 RepID=A0A2T0LER3_9BACL|nr:hypothetical protein CLV97_1111 [Planifilum fimeticola]
MKEKIKMVTTLIAFISLIVVGGVSAASYVTYKLFQKHDLPM